MSQHVTVRHDEGITHIQMDDGKVNAMSTEMLQSVSRALQDAAQKESIAVLHGRAGTFSAGFDLTTFQQGMSATVDMMAAGVDLIVQLLEFPHPVVTVCRGHAYPMGAFLMLAADVRLATDGPWKIGMNEVAIGLTVPNFALELARHRLTSAGLARVTTAGMFTPQEAAQLGYLDRVVPADQMDQLLEEELQRLHGLQQPHFQRTKSRIHGAAAEAIRRAAEAELTSLSAA